MNYKPIEIFLEIILFVTVVLFVGLFSIMIGTAIYDTYFNEVEKWEECNGVVIEVDNIPSHEETTYIMSGNVMIPVTTFYDEKWRAYIGTRYGTFTVDLSSPVLKVDDHLNCLYGRRSKDSKIEFKLKK